MGRRARETLVARWMCACVLRDEGLRLKQSRVTRDVVFRVVDGLLLLLLLLPPLPLLLLLLLLAATVSLILLLTPRDDLMRHLTNTR